MKPVAQSVSHSLTYSVTGEIIFNFGLKLSFVQIYFLSKTLFYSLVFYFKKFNLKFRGNV